MSDFKLRPHHVLCIQNFRGHGYSPKFTENMTSVIQNFEQHNPEITLFSETDILCSSCPHNQQGRCLSYSHVSELDKRFLQSCGLHTGTPITWQTLKKHAMEILKNQHRFQGICYDCSWYKLCSSIVNNS